MSISSLSANVAVDRLNVGDLFWVHYACQVDRVIDVAGNFCVDGHSARRNWVSEAEIEPLTDDESARVTALIALGRGDLV